ncbi:DUF1499 domain-containing protein [Pararhizobium mangrovi]|uniref:DUF1499 domain-containing protein n=1 Tax=Pararhizobium mangrovi TaxID=2590452 RepID=A0A506UDB1_9HYPH|nr:DUF1499 domain-containing protein [Pararhizobium mangrovi]TPW30649.1 DUF1499 domain-containing protein [Pararhizobium mangrovi]
MIARYVRPVSKSALVARRVGLVALILFVAAWFAHRVSGMATQYFVALSVLAGAFALVALCFAFVGFARLWTIGARGGLASFVAFACALVVLAPMALGAWLYVSAPQIRDVSSDAANPPEWLTAPPPGGLALTQTATAALGRPVPLASAYPQLAGRRYEGAIDRVLAAVRSAMKAENLSIVAEDGTAAFAKTPVSKSASHADGKGAASDEEGGIDLSSVPVPINRPSPLAMRNASVEPATVRLQAVHRSMLFGLSSDVVIRLREEGDKTRVDMRVASRYGPNDLGEGARLIRAIFADLDRSLMGTADS